MLATMRPSSSPTLHQLLQPLHQTNSPHLLDVGHHDALELPHLPPHAAGQVGAGVTIVLRTLRQQRAELLIHLVGHRADGHTGIALLEAGSGVREEQEGHALAKALRTQGWWGGVAWHL